MTRSSNERSSTRDGGIRRSEHANEHTKSESTKRSRSRGSAHARASDSQPSQLRHARTRLETHCKEQTYERAIHPPGPGHVPRGPGRKIPETVQAMAEDGVAKTREAYQKFQSVAKDNAKVVEEFVLAAQAGAKAIGEKVIAEHRRQHRGRVRCRPGDRPRPLDPGGRPPAGRLHAAAVGHCRLADQGAVRAVHPGRAPDDREHERGRRTRRSTSPSAER